MERASKTLWTALRRIAKPDRPIDLLVAVWPLIVGPRLAEHTRPLAWTAQRLRVGVDPGPWKRQVERMGKPVRAKVNAWWGKNLVREVEFVAHRPRPEKRTTESRPQPAADDESRRRVAERLKQLEGPLSTINDTELRELVARVAARYLERSDPSK